MSDTKANEKLIVALDVNTDEEAQEIVRSLGDDVSFYKVGWQLFFNTHFKSVRKLGEMGKSVFLDLKMEDIPETILLAISNAPDVTFIELMTLKGTSQLIQAAKQGAASAGATKIPKFLMLTALSSIDDKDIQEQYGPGATLDKIVRNQAENAIAAGCDGLIASGHSVKKLREEFKDKKFLIVAPGIRLKGASIDDHKRTLTPYQAIMDGADYIVVGRPITKAKNRRDAAKEIITEIEKAIKNKGGDSRSPTLRSMAG